MDILLVDDSKIMRTIVQRAIRQAGYQDLVVEEAAAGGQALEKLAQSRPRLILADYNMPEMSGLEMLQMIRAAGNTVPCGFITSDCSGEIARQALRLGASFVITKPFTPEVLQQALKPILG